MVSKKPDLKQSHSAKLNHTAEASSNAIGQTHQSMVTSNNSPESNSGQMELFPMSSSVDTPVSRSALQVVKEAKKTPDISGQKCIDLYESCGHDGSFARMLVDTLNSVSTKYSLHWRLKDTPSGRLLFQRAVSTRLTKETGSGLWQTPRAVMPVEHPDKMRARAEKNGYNNGTSIGSLASQVKYAPPMWLTPNTMDALPPRSEEALKKQYDKSRKGRTTHSTLREQVVYPSPDKMWPTPTATDYKGAAKNRYVGSETYKANLKEAVRHSETDGQLNPTWVEWLMGFPIDHTELKHWETRSSRKSQKQSD